MTGLVFCVAFIFLVVSAQPQSLKCSDSDFASLRTFVDHLVAAPQGWNLNSSSPDCCNWEGIKCDSNSGRVTKLELGRRRLRGNMSEALGHLDHLRILNISRNTFQGSIPQSILHLPDLEILDLSNTGISGIFPDTANLPSIRTLDISGNSITGAAPVGICQNSSKITSLNMADNNFGGTLPPGLRNCFSLNELILASNRFSGDFPNDIFWLQNLRKLDLQENQFSGQLSSRIGNLSKLTYLDLSMNLFTGSLPNVFDRLNGLQYFSAQSNNFTGGIPGSIANSPTIATLSLRNNSLTGKIELNCSAMVGLVSLNLATNPFSGEIPANLPNCTKLRIINFARINFSGKVPESFKNFQSLTAFSLSNSTISNISSTLDILQHCKNLSTLVLSLNFRNEAMPNDPNLQFDSLRILVIAYCRLTGHIPQWLRGCKNLQLLDLSWNRLDGPIPAWFGSLPSLFYLDLSNNTITGDIPIELTRMPNLNDGGNISMEGSSLDFPFFVRRNQSGYKYKQVISFKPTLELGNNRLTGQIWPEFGNLKELHVLDLKWNELTGSIPKTLSGMSSLETLDLSYNKLTGSIPVSLTNLSFLSTFNVAHNNLSGSVPVGGQFLTFNTSSFEGNQGLCWEHTFPPCSTSDPRLSFKEPKKAKGAIIGMGVGIGIGTVVIFAIIYLMILCSCSRKVADQEKENEDDVCVLEMDETSSRVIVCQSKDDDKQIFLDDLLKATANFDQSNIIGCGGFGLVYKAELSDGRKVAIKRLSGEYFQMEREFHAEIETLSRAMHPNLVHLQGYCKYKNDRLLIYTYMEHGSLDYWLHEKIDGPPSLDWVTRLKIAQGAARGLAYLHLSCEPHILHRDIKSSNILLNENFDAHLADFGLARLILPYDTHVTTDLVGTLGYIPPEYSQASVATYKGDIYSFGVVLLELLTGKRPMDMCRPKGFRDMISWVLQMRMEKKETEVFDPFIYDKEHAREMLIVLEIACLCLNENPRVRPGIEQLVTWLDNIDSLTKLNSG